MDRHKPFFEIALPCESCGEPTQQERTWNAEHELWIAPDCTCNTPDQPLPACIRPVIEAAQTVGALMDGIRAHRLTCPVCGPAEISRKPARIEPGEPEKGEEAA